MTGWKIQKCYLVYIFVKSIFYPENVRGIQFESSVLARLLTEEFFLACPPLFVNRRVHRFAKSYYWLCNVCPSVCVRLGLLMDHLSSQRKDFHEILLLNICRNYVSFKENMTKITGSWHEDSCIFRVSDWVLLRVKNVWDKCCREKQNKLFHSKFFNQHFFLCLITFKDITRRMRFTSWIIKAKILTQRVVIINC